MKTYNLFFIGFVLGLFFIASCTKSEPSMKSMEMKKENTNENILKVNIDGIEKVINIQGKSFEQICEDSSGFWMDASMGMTETRGGVSINTNKCFGCMPNNKNMFCNRDDYINYIKINGVDTSDFNMRSMNKG